jgi:hypothetical protein
MARLTVGQKANRVLRLLMGLRNPTVAAVLQEHGFTDQELEEGWRRLSDLTRQRLGIRLAVENPAKVQELDEFENKWFPVARFTLQRHYPAVERELFLNLAQTEGIEVVLSVSTFLERLESLAQGSTPFGSEGPLAMKLLETRGLTAERIQHAKSLLAALGTLSPAQASAPPVAEDQAAEEALWSWYLEWGGIARLVVTDRRSLRAMGFLARRKPGEDEDLEDDDGDDEADETEGGTTDAAAVP